MDHEALRFWGWPLLGLSIICLAFLLRALKRKKWADAGHIVAARCIAADRTSYVSDDDGSTSYGNIATFEYEVQGMTYRKEVKGLSWLAREGQTAYVLYNPDDPADIVAKRKREDFFCGRITPYL